MKFHIFISIVVGMALIGIALGYVFGYWLGHTQESTMWAYLGAPLLAVGGGLVLYATLYDRDDE